MDQSTRSQSTLSWSNSDRPESTSDLVKQTLREELGHLFAQSSAGFCGSRSWASLGPGREAPVCPPHPARALEACGDAQPGVLRWAQESQSKLSEGRSGEVGALRGRLPSSWGTSEIPKFWDCMALPDSPSNVKRNLYKSKGDLCK